MDLVIRLTAARPRVYEAATYLPDGGGMRVRTASTGLGVVVLLVATACGGSSSPSANTAASPPASASAAPSPSPTAAGPQTFTVLVDGHTADNKAFFINYFPKKLQVHPGDTVQFKSLYSGEPHTVALGTAINTAVTTVEALLKKNPHALDNGPPPPALARIPQVLPQGPGDAIQAGAQPCVVGAKGTLPTKAACPVQEEPAFAGTEQLVSSGWFGVDSTWSMTFSPSTPPGDYRMMCQIHGPEMTGTVSVVDAATPIKDAAAVQAQGEAERSAILAKLAPGLAMLAKATPAKAFAGSGVPSVETAMITQFGPQDIKIPVGGTVNWTVLGPHSVGFNAPADAQSLRLPGAGKELHLSQKAFLAAGGPGVDPAAQESPPLIDGGSWNGVGFRSSGVIFGGPPPHSTVFRLKFTKAGSYKFQCTVHEDMKGLVTVG
ncbi:MAG: hypothetical protein QOJ79_139 [Actinomycetota bacterium]|jgi:plastocyanin|nr:hypothetical protein [Actinomycetota bacterium]